MVRLVIIIIIIVIYYILDLYQGLSDFGIWISPSLPSKVKFSQQKIYIRCGCVKYLKTVNVL